MSFVIYFTIAAIIFNFLYFLERKYLKKFISLDYRSGSYTEETSEFFFLLAIIISTLWIMALPILIAISPTIYIGKKIKYNKTTKGK